MSRIEISKTVKGDDSSFTWTTIVHTEEDAKQLLVDIDGVMVGKDGIYSHQRSVAKRYNIQYKPKKTRKGASIDER